VSHQEVWSMCNERYWQSRREQAEESRRIWMDFDRTEAPPDTDAPEETEVEVLEKREEVSAAES
jgi:hypothetical protein